MAKRSLVITAAMLAAALITVGSYSLQAPKATATPWNGVLGTIASTTANLGYFGDYDSGYLAIPTGTTSILFSFSSDNLNAVDLYFSADGGATTGVRTTYWVGGSDDLTHVLAVRGTHVRMLVKNTGLKINGQTEQPTSRLSAAIYSSTLTPATTWYRTHVVQNATFSGAGEHTLFPYVRGPWTHATGITYGLQIVLYGMDTQTGTNPKMSCWLKSNPFQSGPLQSTVQPCTGLMGGGGIGGGNFPGEDNMVLPDALTDMYGKIGVTLSGTDPAFTGVYYMINEMFGP